MRLRDLKECLKHLPQNSVRPRLCIKIGGGCFCHSRNEVEADSILLDAIVEWIVHLWHAGPIDIVVVVSAPGGKTDALIAELKKQHPKPTPTQYARFVCKGETDMANKLAVAINEYCQQRDFGAPAQAFTAKAMGMMADGKTKAITQIKRAEKIVGLMQRKERGIAIAAGFQALDPKKGTLIDLGRGGSDASAVAIAIATGCDLCIFCKDVRQVVAAPPNLVPTAKGFDFVSYPLMYHMARTGSKVLMDRAIVMAQQHMLPMLVALSPGYAPKDQPETGTLIWSHPAKLKFLEGDEKVHLSLGVQTRLSGFTLQNIPNRPGILATIFGALPNIVISDSAQSLTQPSSVSFTVGTETADLVAHNIQAEVKETWIYSRQDGLAAITLIGHGLLDDPNYLMRITSCLGKIDVNVEMLSTSHDSITCVIHQTRLEEAAQVIAEEFELTE